MTSYASNRNKPAFFLEDVSFDLNFSAQVNWNGKTPDVIRFVMPGGSYDEISGNHTFNMGQDFGAGGRLTVIAISQDGTQSVPFDANIEVMALPPGIPVSPFLNDDGVSFSYKLELKDSYSFFTDIMPVEGLIVSENIPIFGDKQISLGIGADMSVTIGSDGTASYSMVGPRPNDSLEMAGVAFDTGWELGGDIIFKYDLENNVWEFDGGYLTSGMSLQKGIGPSYTVVVVGPVPVPLYLRGELGAELNGAIGFTGWSEGNGWELDGTLEPGANGRAIAGVGVASVLAVEGYLGINASMLFGFPEEPVFRETIVALSGGITLVTLFFQYERPIWEYTWSWPEGTGESGLLFSGQELLDIRDIEWEPVSRNYNNGLSRTTVDKTLLKVSGLKSSGVEKTIPGQTDIYPHSYPWLANMGNDLMLVWITDDLLKTQNNRTSVVYSKYSGDQWSTPAKVFEDGTADFYPAVAAITGGSVAVWQDSGALFEDEATMDDMLPEQEISVSVFETSTNTWSSGIRLTSNTWLDRSPEIAAFGSTALTVWISNAENDMLGFSEKPNSLKYSFFDGASWSAESTVANGLGAIIRASLVCNGINAKYVFVIDSDGDISTVNDQDLYMTDFDGTSWSGVSRLTNDSVQDTNPRLAHDQNGDLLMVWYKDGNFKMAVNMDMNNIQGVVDHGLSSGAADFRLAVGDNGQVFIIWPDSSAQGQDLYMAMYDPNLSIWGKGSQVTDTDSLERSLSSVQTVNGSLAVVYNSVETIMTTRQVDVGGTLVEVEVPEAGKTDLCMVIIPIEGDLAVFAENISFTPENIALGDNLDISATVSNIGLKGAENIAVEFYYGDPGDGGELIGSRQTISGPIASGESAVVSITDWPAPETPDADKEIYVVVDPDLACEDSDRGNNVAHISLFKPDIEISQMHWQAMGISKRIVTASIKNIGTVSASCIPVAFKKNGESGSNLNQVTIPYLPVSGSVDVVYVWDTIGEQTSYGYLNLYAVVNENQTVAESSYLNNSRIIQILGTTIDFDGDGDIDGTDLAAYAAGETTGVSLEEFANNFGKASCP